MSDWQDKREERNEENARRAMELKTCHDEKSKKTRSEENLKQMIKALERLEEQEC